MQISFYLLTELKCLLNCLEKNVSLNCSNPNNLWPIPTIIRKSIYYAWYSCSLKIVISNVLGVVPCAMYFFFFKHLYWSIIALQWCVSFCVITKWISYTYTICSHISSLLHVPPSHPPHPTLLGGHKAPSWSPCAMRLLPTSYLFYIW